MNGQCCFTSADNGERIGVCDGMGHREGASCKGIHLKHAHRGSREWFASWTASEKSFHGSRSDIQPVPALWNFLNRNDLCFGAWLVAGGDDTVYRQIKFDALEKAWSCTPLAKVE